jgi:hypothetical protein
MPKISYFSCCWFFLIFHLFICTSCYHMPGENEFSVVPTTNNPSITREKNDSLIPSVSY